MDLDEVLSEIGDFGLYQNVVFYLVSVPGNFFVVWQIMATVFTAAWPDSYTCSLEDGALKNESIPVEEYDENGDPVYDSCYMYINSTVDNSTTACTDGYDYVAEFEETIVTEWDLVCDQAALSQVSQSIYMIGVMIGALVAGYLSDKFGRKTLFLVCLWSLGVFGTLTAFTQTFIGYCIMKFFVGLMQPGTLITQFILSTELYTPSKRIYAGFISCIMWALGMMLLAVIGYLFQHWRAFQIIISAPALLTFYYYWVIPESMRWLLSKGRNDSVHTILKKAAKINGVQLSEDLFCKEITVNGEAVNVNHTTDPNEKVSKENTENGDAVNVNHTTDPNERVSTEKTEKVLNEKTESPKTDDTDSDPDYGCIHLVSTPRMALYSTVMGFAWFVCSLVYYGLSYNTMNFEGSVYALFFLAGCVEIPAYALCIPIVARCGRRWPSCIFLVLSGLTCICLVFFPEDTADGTSLLGMKITLMLLGKFAITGGYGTVYVWAPELYPTLLRNFGFSVCEFCASLAGIVAPLTVVAARYNVAIPFTIFGFFSLLAGVSVLLLPETKDKIMPRTIEEAENLAKASPMKTHKKHKDKTITVEQPCYQDITTQTDWGDEDDVRLT